ncbi:MAG: DUF429 domain-containing protein [Burkholderiales bacterium]|nr:DUF429 domain-containing protein [Burkholderiales bacterium]
MTLYGIDFTSRPCQQKPITVAVGGQMESRTIRLKALETHTDFTGFEAFLNRPGPWLGGFDFPFGLPRELVLALDWPRTWPELIHHVAQQQRADLRERFKGFCNARPVGNKFAHRAVDALAQCSPSMKWVNPPVAWMLLEGAPRLLDAGVHLPGLHVGDPNRVALEAYPALLARKVIGRESYKSDEPARQTAERTARRARIVEALEAGYIACGLRLYADNVALRDRLIADGSGDLLDAVLCMMQAAAAALQGAPRYGLPECIDPLEGWIATVGP